MTHPPASKILPFRRAKMIAKFTSAGQFTGQRTIGELLLLKRLQVQKSRRATSDTPLKLREVMSLQITFQAFSLL